MSQELVTTDIPFGDTLKEVTLFSCPFKVPATIKHIIYYYIGTPYTFIVYSIVTVGMVEFWNTSKFAGLTFRDFRKNLVFAKMKIAFSWHPNISVTHMYIYIEGCEFIRVDVIFREVGIYKYIYITVSSKTGKVLLHRIPKYTKQF